MGVLGRFNSDGTVAEYPSQYARGGQFLPSHYEGATRVVVHEDHFYCLLPSEKALSDAEVQALLVAEGVVDAPVTSATAEPVGGEEAEDVGAFAVAITAEPETGDPPLHVQFTLGPIPEEWVVKSYAWDFGDTHTSRKQNPDHSFDLPGTYDVTVKVKTEEGLVGEGRAQIIVSTIG